MMMILSGAWPQATAWRGPGAACDRKASAGASRPARPGYGLREIQGRESSGRAASLLNIHNSKTLQHYLKRTVCSDWQKLIKKLVSTNSDNYFRSKLISFPKILYFSQKGVNKLFARI